jgi:hypothetical protein
MAFPVAGVPEMMMSPNVAAQLQRLTPEQRNLFIAQMIQQKQQSQSQSQHQFQHQQQSQQPNFNLNLPNFGDPANFPPMNMLGNSPPGGNQTIGGTMMSMMGQPGGLHRRTPSGNAMPQAVTGLSYEVLQSFMQRNADGSGPMGPS